MAHIALLVLVLFANQARSLENGVGRTPAMGYNTWDDFRCSGINAANVKRVADAFVQLGLRKFGYEYIGIDDCWAVSRDPKTGVIQEDPKAFPQGMKAVADYVHSKGLKFGIYTDRGTATCVGRPGSQGYEKIDAETYAKWGVDLVKEDSCNAPDNHTEAFRQYALMRDALNATGRPVYFALCGWSDWYAQQGNLLGNSWRYGYDVNDWSSAWSNSISASSRLARYAGPGAWNDPDALIGSSTGAAVHMTPAQSRTQFSLWAIMAAPLEIGSNILNMSAFDLETYTNEEVIAVDQDVDGIQGQVIWHNCGSAAQAPLLTAAQTGRRSRERRRFAEGGNVAGSCVAVPPCQQIWSRKIHDGFALAFVNYTSPLLTQHANSNSGSLSLAPCKIGEVRQLWNIGNSTGGLSTVESATDAGGCWEINGCNYHDGAAVDTSFGCKALPGPGVEDPCCSNMAWVFHANGSITSAYSGLCFEVCETGGCLKTCSENASQQWHLRGSPGKQQLVSAAGSGCIVSGIDSSRQEASQEQEDTSTGMIFDVTSLGWQSAHVRDLWAHTDLGVMTRLRVKLAEGAGASKLFKLTKSGSDSRSLPNDIVV